MGTEFCRSEYYYYASFPRLDEFPRGFTETLETFDFSPESILVIDTQTNIIWNDEAWGYSDRELRPWSEHAAYVNSNYPEQVSEDQSLLMSLNMLDSGGSPCGVLKPNQACGPLSGNIVFCANCVYEPALAKWFCSDIYRWSRAYTDYTATDGWILSSTSVKCSFMYNCLGPYVGYQCNPGWDCSADYAGTTLLDETWKDEYSLTTTPCENNPS